MFLLSIVTPVYKAENIIPQLIYRIEKAVIGITPFYEIILVDDGSPDNSWMVIEETARENPKITGIKLSRNFGQHNAITAGLNNAKGDWIVVMDCDLQDQPEEIPKLYHKALEGYDIVLARRKVRNDNYIKRLTSRVFYKLFSYLTETEQDSTVANFGIYSRKAIDSIKSMGDYFRVFPILIQWIGYRKYYLDIQHAARYEGKSSYTAAKLFRLAFDMIVSFSEKPMRIGLKIGLIISGFSIFLSIYYLISYLSGIIKVPGYASLVVLLTFSTGIILTFLGLVGTYIGKISLQVKNRPNFIIQEKIN